MDVSILAGMFLWEAKDVLQKAGVMQYEVAVTAPPRHTDRMADDNDRVLMVDRSSRSLRLLVCKTSI